MLDHISSSIHQTPYLFGWPMLIKQQYYIDSMKFLFAAATLLGLSASQRVSSNLIVSPISVYEEPQPEPTANQQETINPVIEDQEEIKQLPQDNVIEVIQPVIQPETPSLQPSQIFGGDREDLRPDHFHDTEFPGPMPGREQFNPTDPAAERERNQKDGRDKHKSKKKHNKQKTFKAEDSNHNTRSGYPQNQEKLRAQSHGKLWGHFLIVAIIFTFIGVLLGKCLIKIKKCRKHCRERREALKRTASTVQEQIRLKEERVNQLKALFAQKMHQQQSMNLMNRPESFQNQTHEARMIQMLQPQQFQNAPLMRGRPLLRAYPN